MTDLARSRLLNYGCGFDKRPGYLNVDSDPNCQPDLLITGNDLSVLPRESFEEVLAMDVLEHIPRVETPNIMLEWADLLVTGGRLRVETSSIDGVARQIAKDQSFAGQYGWTHCLFGTQAHPGDFHLTGFTETTLTVYMLAAGFDVERVWVTGLWLLNAEATKARSWTHLVGEMSGAGDAEFVDRAYREALFRAPDDAGLGYFVDALASGLLDRRSVMRQLMASPEHLFVTAERHGFGRAPKRSIYEIVRPHVPERLMPPLRAMNRSTRAATEHGRRALGSFHRERVGS